MTEQNRPKHSGPKLVGFELLNDPGSEAPKTCQKPAEHERAQTTLLRPISEVPSTPRQKTRPVRPPETDILKSVVADMLAIAARNRVWTHEEWTIDDIDPIQSEKGFNIEVFLTHDPTQRQFRYRLFSSSATMSEIVRS